MGILDEYLAGLEEPKRSEISTLHHLIQKHAPAFELERAGSMLGYGRYHYRYDSGREGTSHRICVSANKTGISLYVSATDERGWLAEQSQQALGKKVSVGKSCIRMKQLADVDLPALTALIARASHTPAPGMVATSAPSLAAKTKKPVEKKVVAKTVVERGTISPKRVTKKSAVKTKTQAVTPRKTSAAR